jgi:hypothetical protein
MRKTSIVPLLNDVCPYAGSYYVLGNGAVMVCWTIDEGRVLTLAANLSNNSTDGFSNLSGDTIWQEGPEPMGTTMRPWSVRWIIGPGVCQ